MISDGYAGILAIAVGLALVPLLLSLTTAYLKVSIVLGLLKNALGTQQVPGSMTVMALSLVMTMIVMRPIISQTVIELDKVDLTKVKLSKLSDLGTMLTPIVSPLKTFLEIHAGAREKKSLLSLHHEVSPPSALSAFDDWIDLLGAFMLTELKEAFAMGFALLIPFLVVDIVVANVLVGMGLHMVTPTMISLPVKLLVLGFSSLWIRLTEALVQSYG